MVGSSSAAAGKSSGRIVGKGKRRDFFSCGLLIYFFLRAVAAWQHCVKLFPAAEFKDANGATEILNTACTHDGEADAVISEVIVQNKVRTKCSWTHELIFPLFLSPLCLSLVC